MRRITYLLTCVALLAGQLVSTAQEALTIEEAVMGAYVQYAPERIKDLKWIPGTDTYSYRSGEGRSEVVMMGSVGSEEDVELFGLVRVRESFLGAGFVEPEEIPPFDWMEDEKLLFRFKGQFWEFDYKWKTVTKRISCTRVVANHELAPDKFKLAGTVASRVYLSDKMNDTIPLTEYREGVVSGQAVSRYEFGISKGLFWSPDSRKLAYYEKDESAVTDYQLMDYVTIPAGPAPVKYPMAGQGSEVVKVKVYDMLRTDHITLETEGDEDQYLTSVTWTLDSKHVLVSHVDRSQNHMKLVKYDASTGKKVKVLFEEHDDEYVEPEQGAYMLPGTKGEFLWFSERDGFNHIYHYSPEGKLLGQVTKGDRVMKKILHYDTDTKMLIVAGTDSPLEEMVYKVSLKGGKMTRLTTEKGVHRVKVSDSGKYLLDTYSNLTTPRSVVLRDENGKVIKTLLEAADPLEGKKVGSTEVSSLKAKDGTDLYYRLIKPSDFDPSKKYPVLVYVYNGPHVQLVEDTWNGGASLWMYSLAEEGFLIFSLDGRGSSDRGLEFEQAVHSTLGILESQDQLAGVDYLKSLNYVDQERLFIHGWSYGGFMTLNLMLRHPGVFKAGIAGGAVTDWRFYEIMYTERYMDEPQDNEVGYESTRMAPLASALEGDLLMIHGSSDDIVVPQHYMVMLNAFINAGKQVDTFIYPGHGHNVVGPDRVHLITQIADYLKERD